MEQASILIIDDGDDLVRYCEHFLPATLRILHARNGKEGLEILDTRPVKLVILDKVFDRIPQPELLGRDAANEGLCILKILRQRHARLPVVMVTAHADAATRREALSLGALEYFSWEAICGEVGILRALAEG